MQLSSKEREQLKEIYKEAGLKKIKPTTKKADKYRREFR